MLGRLFDPILSAVYPQQCYVCDDLVEFYSDGVACGNCWASTTIFDGSQVLCLKCGAPQKYSRSGNVESCPNCLEAHYDAAFAVGNYERALAATVVSLKKVPHLSRRANELFAGLLERVPSKNSVIIPVPLSKRRKFERGYNQAEVLAAVLAKVTGLPCYTTCLLRSRHTPMHRVAMDKKAREVTVEKAFEVRSPKLIQGKDVLLVDDVFTSGSTASACARVLKKAGSGKVTVVTLARAVM